MKRQKKETDGFRILLHFSFFLFAYMIAVVLTLYFHDGYFDLMESKSVCFLFIMKIMAPFLVVTETIKIVRKKIERFCLFDYALMAFLFASFISTALAYDTRRAVIGDQGWYVGSFVTISLIVIYFTFRDTDSAMNRYLFPALFICIFEYALTIAEGMGLDLLGMKTDYNGSFYRYFAMLGNSNWCVGYLALTVPLMLCLCLNEDAGTIKIVK